MAPPLQPTAQGLVSETEGTLSRITNGVASLPTPSSSSSLSADDLVDARGTILLPDGKRVRRPVFPANKEMYTRVPPHLMKPDGTPNYMLMSLTSNVYSILPEGTPLTPAVSLSQRLGNNILLKREDMTPVFSFKLRGAYNMMRQLTEEERWRGVIACSAGNHAQGVAMSGRELGIACTIVMPLNTPSIKYQNVDRLGARVVLHGADFDEAQRECARLAKLHGLTIIPPFNDPYVIAGQGTAAVEVLRQADVSELDAVFIPVGGGGFLAGMAAYIKAVAPPSVKVIGVETHDADALAQTLRKGEHLTLNEVGLFADGTAVRRMGDETLRVCAELVDEIILVSNDELCAAIKDVFQDTRSVPEPSGALGVAGAKKWIQQNNLIGKKMNFVSIVSGANINFSRLRFIAERAELGEGKEAMLRVIIPEKPGAFLALHSAIHPRAVTEFVYRYSSSKRAFIFLSFYLSSSSSSSRALPPQTGAGGGTSTPVLTPAQQRKEELSSIVSTLAAGGMKALDISDNELAKSHARYLVGGKSKVPNERMFRFEFPERPGALRKFLETLGTRFNISLFHYRNHGGDVGKILCGIQVPKEENSIFDEWVVALKYPFVEETSNPAYADFLGDEDGDATDAE
ncbi:Threonine ammonia-lyase [Rhodotorula toruloides ATCC 204091]|uniref:Threonine dehydratase n=1 Tax=Rhodotorula toruloides TaxID=5286 RepID=A0A0K3C5L0_RHOTO|nr:Threonine ammonia-lyase [Rhodotorula toruloides ATCC 204091]PRQ76491.1 threonine ammonia-lyase [Rhodotorula toruloides]